MGDLIVVGNSHVEVRICHAMIDMCYFVNNFYGEYRHLLPYQETIAQYFVKLLDEEDQTL